ncbi:MAG: hypothetical protein A3G49_05570 [Candidatus Sungbacteria bacterium RIFCSPLOWO2_12_FULL_41_11]|uniref:Uncharacterized protein n=1 Tax=Candidatus Sungbacteria bacterium RIFCSPLOWO2_12_FULL_41_11 TaxID=1802286 RepID=A0A1G2LSY6_9BACT|nr:MAG: hypothetical protein UV01_C0008G0040 [Parcubacteria group bacterium GW2011_GWA2_42_14]OGZ99193.1 MAG: hypothetical protein A3D41_02730 [Candidatus Sungbacteria bacterium RIFCSPHIGHO2_02_FULL_41_12b]OHA14624.1 MAG: hypothetical protein A3G49_05570 [Candidatus Sungbacteria bacterium RIFCSPLOWO2_12_FULL_41_11]
MNNFEKSKKLPVGSPDFEKARSKEQYRLPALEVKNTVIKRNTAFPELPFKFEVGKQTPLGIFFTKNSEKYQEKKRRPVIMPEDSTGRSGSFGPVIFKDREGRMYRDVDAKGIGYYYKETLEENYVIENTKRDDPLDNGDPRKAPGLMDYEFALRDMNYSEKFIHAGIRTHRVLGIIDLEEIIVDEEKISVEEARKRGFMNEEMHPVAEVRAFGTKERIAYLDNRDSEDQEKAIDDARRIVSAELGKDPDQFSSEDYLRWFSETLGQQVAKIRKLKLHHGYISTHNITLDCRIVDLDSVTPVKEFLADNENMTEDDIYSQDYFGAKTSLDHLVSDLNLLSTKSSADFREKGALELFKKAYEEELKTKRSGAKSKPREAQKAA